MTRKIPAFSLLLVALAGAAALFAVAAPEPSSAQPQAAPSPNAQAALVLRVLGYDRGLRGRTSGNSVHVLTLYKAGDSTSEGACNGLARAINQLGRAVNISGMRARATAVAFSSADGLTTAGRGAQAVFVCSGLESSIGDIAGAARRASLLAISAREADARAGLGVAIVPGSQLRLVVNVTAASAQGAQLDAALLRIATVVR